MTTAAPVYDFYPKLARIINAGASRSVFITGNVSDLFWNGTIYTPLIPFITKKTESENLIQIVYEFNSPIRISPKDRASLLESWVAWKTGCNSLELKLQNEKRVKELQDQFEGYFNDAIGSAASAVQLLRQLCFASRATQKQLLIIIGGADMIFPSGDGDLSKLSDNQLRRISTAQEWFGNPDFVAGKDTVCLVSESLSKIHEKVSTMPQFVSVDVESPNLLTRQHFIEFLYPGKNLWEGDGTLAEATAGLSIYALRQMLVGANYAGKPLTYSSVIDKVEEYIKSQLGEDVVEFKKPTHTLDDIKGNSKLKDFLRKKVIPRVKAGGKFALAGCAVAGPIGGGKTHIFGAVATHLDSPVMTLKNLRSQWFGGTDIIGERIYRVIRTMSKLTIEIDEADTQFGGLGSEVHETERRLTGKIQQMMSDPELKGKVFWILMTARIQKLSADIRRPGRAGDLIIPVLDPIGDDRLEFINWVLEPLKDHPDLSKLASHLDDTMPAATSAGEFGAMRSYLSYEAMPHMPYDEVIAIIEDLIPADIATEREYQTLQALVNCTRKCLLPKLEDGKDIIASRSVWQARIKKLESEGIQ